MAYSEVLAQSVRLVLTDLLPLMVLVEALEEKEMFGGLAFMLRGKMLVCVDEHDIMVHIGKRRYDQLMPRPGATTTQMQGKRYPDYINLDTLGQQELNFWLGHAIEFNRALTAQ